MSVRILVGDCRARLAELPDQSVQCCVTSPPYFGLRDYGCDGQIGLEATPDAFVAELVAVFRDVRRVLRDDGTLWLNLGDTYQNSKGQAGGVDPKQAARRHGLRPQDGPPPAGLKPKDLIGIPWMAAFALRADGWYLRQEIIWHKLAPMPESVTDRCTKAHEQIFLLSKSRRYHFDAGAIAEERVADEDANGFRGGSFVGGNIDNETCGLGRAVGNRKRGVPPRHSAYPSSDQSGLDTVARGEGRNKRSVWSIGPAPFSEAHFATFPPALVEPCILAGCPRGGMVLDPFGGAGTTGLVADRLGRHCTLIELNPAYAEIARKRLQDDAGMFAAVEVAQ